MNELMNVRTCESSSVATSTGNTQSVLVQVMMSSFMREIESKVGCVLVTVFVCTLYVCMRVCVSKTCLLVLAVYVPFMLFFFNYSGLADSPNYMARNVHLQRLLNIKHFPIHAGICEQRRA